jgi:hypothetical protein
MRDGAEAHARCTREKCEVPGYEDDPDAGTEIIVPGNGAVEERRRFYQGCPVKHVTPEVAAWLRSYRWLRRWNLTPVAAGIAAMDELDPRWFRAMELIDGEMVRIESERIEAASRGRR